MKHEPRAASRRLMLLVALLLPAVLSPAATLGPDLKSRLTKALPDDPLGTVIVAFEDDEQGLQSAHLSVLESLGLSAGQTLPELGMVAVNATAAQVLGLADKPAVRSVYANRALHYTIHEARVVTGVEAVETNAAFTAANGGLPLSGAGDFSVVINDSGIDATHADLSFGDHVVQNVQIVADTSLTGFNPLVFVENVPNTDTHVGHGTHCAGIVGGNGVQSGSKYRGVAPGAKLIGTGSGVGLFILNALGGFEWSLAHQAQYGIRVISNSWGSTGPFDPDDPVNIASRRAYERNIVVVFAAGNEGPAPDTHNPYAKAPWVISVAAGTKEGGLATFSSRGTPREVRLTDDDPHNDFDAPTITAPGTGREFETNAEDLTAAIVSTRALSNVVSTGLTDDTEIEPGNIPFYTQISGTSMACPHVAGVVALLLDANPLLTPDEIKSILVRTATAMPGYADWEAGAGYINVRAAVDAALNGNAADYGPLQPTTFNAQVETIAARTEVFQVEFDPTAETGGANARTFTVADDVAVLEVTASYGNTDLSSQGNLIILVVTAPDGTRYTDASSVLFVTEEPRRYVKVVNPQPGEWIVEPRGARGLAAVPEASSPVALALPDRIALAIDRASVTVSGVTGIAGHPDEAAILTAIGFRYIDTLGSGNFRPDRVLSRLEFARLLGLNTPLRQTDDDTTWSDVHPNDLPVVRAVVAPGATLRQFDYTSPGLLALNNGAFDAQPRVTRMDTAIALIRALGREDEAEALVGMIVTAPNRAGQTVAVVDLLDIPSSQRGYAQLALDMGLIRPRFTTLGAPRFDRTGGVTRADGAVAFLAYRDYFSLM